MHRLTPTSAQKLLTCLCTYCEAVIRELAILGRCSESWRTQVRSGSCAPAATGWWPLATVQRQV